MTAVADGLATTHYISTDVVAVFSTEAALENAVDELGLSGVDRAAISVRDAGQAPGQGASPMRSSAAAEDPGTRMRAFVAHSTRVEGNAVAIAVPLLVCGFAAAWAAADFRSSLAATTGAVGLGGAVGAAFGFWLYRVIKRRHTNDLQRQLVSGGFALWVNARDNAAEQSASAVLRRCGAISVRSCIAEREWGAADTPFNTVQPDPFLA